MAKRILIVDDDKSVLELLGFYLTGEGYSVDTAEGVSAALEAIALRDYGIMLLDRNMPGTDGNMEGGFELLRYVRSLSSPSAVIMMSGNATARSWSEALQLGAVDLISKPFSLMELGQRIERILR